MWSVLSGLLGGLGLLLIGMSMMTDGLKLAAGNALSSLLAQWTNTRLRGLAAGLLITAVVQSSSAVTVATIGFANAGILSLERAIWVIFGSNVGTTMTAWIVALVGFKLDIEAIALPLVGVGALLKLTAGHSRRGSYGVAVVGFALLFLGIGALKSSFDGLAGTIALPGVAELTPASLLLYVGVGFAMTTLMQSSSASMVVALSAAESGLVEINAAAAVVIGANLGTTSTALLTMIGATPNARRVAISHLAFNLVTAVVALLLLGPMLWLVGLLQDSAHLAPGAAVTLAVFHTLFNIMGVLLMWPLSAVLVARLARLFHAADTRITQPRYLDRSTLGVPYTGVTAMTKEVRRIALHTGRGLLEILRDRTADAGVQRADVRSLAAAVGDFAVQLNRGSLTPFLVDTVASLLAALQRYLTVVALGADIQRLRGELAGATLPAPAEQAITDFSARVEAFVRAWQDGLGESGQELLPDYDSIRTVYDGLKHDLLQLAAAGNLSIPQVDLCLQYLDELRRACRQLARANARLGESLVALQQGSPGARDDLPTISER